MTHTLPTGLNVWETVLESSASPLFHLIADLSNLAVVVNAATDSLVYCIHWGTTQHRSRQRSRRGATRLADGTLRMKRPEPLLACLGRKEQPESHAYDLVIPCRPRNAKPLWTLQPPAKGQQKHVSFTMPTGHSESKELSSGADFAGLFSPAEGDALRRTWPSVLAGGGIGFRLIDAMLRKVSSPQ